MELVEHLVRWGIHPGGLITDEFPLERADEAYALMASGKCGKVSRCFPGRRITVRANRIKKKMRQLKAIMLLSDTRNRRFFSHTEMTR